MKLCLDLESVLAESKDMFIDRLNEAHNEDWSATDITYWEWVEDNADYEDEFMAWTNDIWRNEWMNIPASEGSIEDKVEALANRYSEVHVVTARDEGRDVESGMRKWLKHKGITNHATDFEATETYKSQLGYDVYIDDNPYLADEMGEGQHLFLYDQPWNREINNGRRVTRITSLFEAFTKDATGAKMNRVV